MKTYKFTVNTYGADTPHRGKHQIPLHLRATGHADAEAQTRKLRPLSHIAYIFQKETK